MPSRKGQTPMIFDRLLQWLFTVTHKHMSNISIRICLDSSLSIDSFWQFSEKKNEFFFLPEKKTPRNYLLCCTKKYSCIHFTCILNYRTDISPPKSKVIKPILCHLVNKVNKLSPLKCLWCISFLTLGQPMHLFDNM